MNYKKYTGWYYNSVNDRAPAWSGVEFLYKFLVNNKGAGPRGEETNIDRMKVGDIVQLSFDGISFTHTLIVVNIEKPISLDNLYIASHTYDSYNRRVSFYEFKNIRFINIEGVWQW